MTAMLLGLLIVSGAALAQGDPKSNVNVVGMTPDPADFPDIYYRQQNEPACAVRPGDSACIICAYNDYRAVDEIGDAWEGVSQSCDAGDSWLSRLAPGHPGDTDADIIPAEFAADPRLAAIPGMAIFNFIAGYRDSNNGVLAIQHWLEVNKEDADHYEPGRQTYFADTGTSGRFLDKPDMLAVLDPPNRQGTISLSTVMENTELGTITRDYPTGKLYVAFAVFTGSQSVKVLVKTSDDWGKTWANKTLKLSEEQNEVSGVTLTAVGNKVLAVWRRKGDNNDPDSILYSVISNGGKKATKGKVLADICAFDQPTLTGEENLVPEVGPFGPIVTFRTNDFPWTANDGENFFVFYSDRGRNPDGSCSVSGRPRIVMHHASGSGTDWNATPIPLETGAPADSFQFMPAAFGANGKIQVVWYDTRRETIGGALTPYSLVADYDFGEQLYVQRTVDVYTTNVTMTGGTPVVPTPVRVSQYSVVVDEETQEAYENEASLANKKIFGQGTASFLGDYIAVAAREYRKTGNGTAWESNASSAGPGVYEDFFAAWADNRDIRGQITNLTDPLTTASVAGEQGPQDDDSAADEMLAAAHEVPRTGPPRDTSKTAEGLEGDDLSPPSCVAGKERSRDANVYGSLIKDRLRLYAPTPAKPLIGLLRAFPLSISNSTEADETYRLEIIGSSAASFRQQAPLSTDVLTVPALSSAARTVFIEAGQSVDLVRVEARLCTDAQATSCPELVATIELSDTQDFADPENCPPGDTTCAVATSELHDLELQTLDSGAAALLNAALLNAALLNPSIDAAALLNANLLNANLLNADLLNANLLNPTLVALALEGAAADPNCSSGQYSSLCAGDPDTAVGEEIVQYAADNPDRINAALLNAALLNAALLNANLLNANLLNANLLNANLLNANLLNADLLNANLLNANLLNANLLNANLLNANLLNANLLNADLLNANLLNANLLNANLLNATPADAKVTYDDYTYPVTNNGNVTTSINADVIINAPMVTEEDGVTPILDNDGNPSKDILGTKLIAWTVNATPTNIDCEDRVQLDTRVQAIVPNPDSVLEEADINSPFDGEVSTIAAAGETVFFTLRVFGTPEQLKEVRVSGFTASSQAANCFADGTTPGFCEENLRDENEKILIKDTTPPVLTLPADITAEATSPAGAAVSFTVTATDNIDLNPTVVCVPESGEIFGFGTTMVGCSAFDSVNNGVSGEFNVTVEDTTAPSISLIGPSTVTLEAGVDTYTEPGANATDAADPSVAVTIGGDAVDTGTVGNYVVTYDAIDVFGNAAAQVTRTVNVVDTIAPVITLNGPEAITLEAGIDTYVEAGANAADAGDPLIAVVIGGDAVDTGTVGTYVVTYNAVDASGNAAAQVTRTVDVVDTTAPVITLIGPTAITLEAGVDSYAEQGANVSDEGDPSVTVTIGGDAVDTGTVGTYVVTYNAVDASGNAATEVIRTVTVVDTTAPVITLNGPAAVTLEAGVDTYTEAGATVTDAGDASVGVVVSGVVDTTTVGTYVVTYNAVDASGNAAISKTLTVTVVDSTAPVIVLNGDAALTLEADRDTYVELGATVIDAGNPTTTLIIGGDVVDTNAVGVYLVTYNANDGFNTAIQVVRTVTVVDTTAPEFDPVEPPDGFDPNTPYPFELDADANSISVTWPVTVTDADPNLAISCSVDGNPLPLDGPLTTNGDTITATFAYDFPVGFTAVNCTATDSNGLTTQLDPPFVVEVLDVTAPVITVPTDPAVFGADTDPAIIDYADLVSVFDAVYPDTEATCVPASGSEFPWGNTLVSCNAVDGSGNLADTVTFTITVRFPYDIELTPPKKRPRAGSTVPLDWKYLDSDTQQAVDSSTFMVGITWEKASNNSCTNLTPASTDGSSFINDADSGNSDFRYSDSDDSWQLSWQTPNATGWHKLSISPPGGGVPEATACIRLR
jgi:uncharacterized protein YjbI with pentapeptide repeats